MEELFKLFSLQDILFHVLNIVILYVLIRLLLYKPIRRFMQARAQRVADQLDDAQRLREQADARQAQLDAEAQQAKIDAAQAIADGVQQGQHSADEMLARAQRQVEEIVAQAREEAQRIQLESRETMRAQAVSMAVEIAGRMLEREVRPEDHQRIIEQFLTKVG